MTLSEPFERARLGAKLAPGPWRVVREQDTWVVVDMGDNLVAIVPSEKLGELIAALPELCAQHPSKATTLFCQYVDSPVSIPLNELTALNPVDAFVEGYTRGYFEGVEVGFDAGVEYD
jgi:hypothetical protein